MALKRYKTLDECLEKNGFDKKDVCIVGTHIMAKHTVTGLTYVCHIKFEEGKCINPKIYSGNWCIDECKVYEKHEAIKLMAKFAIDEANQL